MDDLDKNVILDGIALERVKHTKFLRANWWFPYMEKSYWMCLQNNLP